MNICKYCLLCCISALYLLPAALLSLLNKAKHAPIFFVGSAGICKKLDWQISMFKDDNVKPIFRNYFLKPLLSVDRYMLNVLRHVKYRWKYIKLNPPWRYRCRSWRRSWRWWERARGKSRTPPKLATEPPPEQKICLKKLKIIIFLLISLLTRLSYSHINIFNIMWSYHNIRPKGATSHTSIISMWDHNITLSSKTSIICRMKLVQEGKSWKARNLLSSQHSKSLTSKSKLSSLCSNSWARLRCYPHFPSSMHIKPRSGCHRLSSNLDWSWNWLAIGSGLPRNAFLWPIVSNLCSLLSLTVLNKGVSFFSLFYIFWP